MATSYKRWVTTLVAKVAAELNLYDWKIQVHFDEEDNDEATAWVYIDARYLSAHIHICPRAKEFWDEGAMDILQECVVHEVTHILLNPLHEIAKQATSPATQSQLTDTLEQATHRLARVVIAHLPKNFFSV